jgi:hypothetical protein
VNLPTAFNMPIELGSDVELDEVYSQERRAWAEAQRNDLALRKLVSLVGAVRTVECAAQGGCAQCATGHSLRGGNQFRRCRLRPLLCRSTS